MPKLSGAKTLIVKNITFQRCVIVYYYNLQFLSEYMKESHTLLNFLLICLKQTLLNLTWLTLKLNGVQRNNQLMLKNEFIASYASFNILYYITCMLFLFSCKVFNNFISCK